MAFTENVTILVLDLKGSTSAASALSPEVADDQRMAHVPSLRTLIQSFGGVEVRNSGDELMVVFTTASAAFSCAVSMEQLVALVNSQAGHRLHLRVGLSRGEITREGDDFFGEPVVEAAGLCDRAQAGQILAAELPGDGAGRRNPYRLRPLGPVQLMGLLHPTAAVEIVWEPLPENQTVWSASVKLDGDEFHVTPSGGLVFGRANTPDVIGLDDNDMGISAVAGSIEWQWGVWWVVNHSRKRALLLDLGNGDAAHRLDCGQRFAITTPRITVLVVGAIFTHRIDIGVPEVDLARMEQGRSSSGTLPVDDLRLTERDKGVLAALFSGYLEAFPRRSGRPLTYRQAAELLGPPWSPLTVRKQVERVKERARRGGLYFEGPHANQDLADHLVTNSLLVPSDLGRLSRTPTPTPAQ